MIHNCYSFTFFDSSFWYLKIYMEFSMLCVQNPSIQPQYSFPILSCNYYDGYMHQTSGCILEAQRKLPKIQLQLESPMKKGSNSNKAKNRFIRL